MKLTMKMTTMMFGLVRWLVPILLLKAMTASARAQSPAGPDQYHSVVYVDPENPVPVDVLAAAGVDYVYIRSDVPFDDEAREALRMAFDFYRESGIRVLYMGQFYEHAPEGTAAIDFFGRTERMACFRQPAYRTWLEQTLTDLTGELAADPAFGGFAFGDGAQVNVASCYCDLCRELFSEQYGIGPPPFEAQGGTARVPDDHPRLLWEQFHRASFESFNQLQAAAVRAVDPGLLAVTIPSDSWYFGRHLDEQTTPAEYQSHRLKRIERLHVRDWHLFQSFPLARLPRPDETGLQRWGVGTHLIADSPKMFISPEDNDGPEHGRVRFMNERELARSLRVSLLEGGGAFCFWAPARALPHVPEVFEGIAGTYADVRRIEALLVRRRSLPGRVALVYSTTTEIFEQPWRERTLERWRHLHAFEGLAWSLTRSNLPFDVILEDEMEAGDLRRYEAVLLPSVRFLSASTAAAFEQAAAAGTPIFALGEHPGLADAATADYDALLFYRHLLEGRRGEPEMLAQWREFEANLLPHLPGNLADPARRLPLPVSSDGALLRLYTLGDEEWLLMAVNWSLDEAAELRIGPGLAVNDAMANTSVPAGIVAIEPAGWRVLTIKKTD